MFTGKLRITLNLLQEELPTIIDEVINDTIAIQKFQTTGEYTYALEDGTVIPAPNNHKDVIKAVQHEIVEFIYYIICYPLETSPNDNLLVMFTYHSDIGWQKLTVYPLLIIDGEIIKIGDSWQDPDAEPYPPKDPSLKRDCEECN